MKKGLAIAGAVMLGGGAVGLATLIAYLVVCTHRAEQSVGIIGGADAPTAIFLTNRLGVSFAVVLLPLVLSIVIGAALLIAALIMKLSHKKPEK